MKRILAVFGWGAVVIPDEQATAFKKHLGGKSCDKCHKLFNNHAWMGFVMHLIDGHGVDPEVSYRILHELSDQFVSKFKSAA